MSENGGTLTVYQRMNDPLAAITLMGNAIAKSGMYGCGNIEAGQVLAMECLHQNTPPLSILRRFNIMFGRLSMKAEAMLAGFEQEGGKYEIISRTPDLIRVIFTINGKSHNLSLSWEEAQKEPFAYQGKEDDVVGKLVKGERPPLKPKYATPRSRMQMLWARLVSDSVRFLCPRVVTGVYTPEEIDDFTDEEAEVARAAKTNGRGPKPTPVVDPAKAAAVDVPFELKVSPDKPGATVTPATVTGSESTPAQWDAIRQLFDTLYGRGTDKRQKTFDAALAKRNAKSLSDLSAAQADEIIAALRSKVESTRAAADAALPRVEPPSPAEDPTTASSGPCTPELDAQIKSELQQWKQIDPATYDKEFVWLKGKLAESKRAKIAELSYGDAKKLLAAVQTRNLASFIQASLQPKPEKPVAAATPEAATA
jgi:hypothetical protein